MRNETEHVGDLDPTARRPIKSLPAIHRDHRGHLVLSPAASRTSSSATLPLSTQTMPRRAGSARPPFDAPFSAHRFHTTINAAQILLDNHIAAPAVIFLDAQLVYQTGGCVNPNFAAAYAARGTRGPIDAKGPLAPPTLTMWLASARCTHRREGSRAVADSARAYVEGPLSLVAVMDDHAAAVLNPVDAA